MTPHFTLVRLITLIARVSKKKNQTVRLSFTLTFTSNSSMSISINSAFELSHDSKRKLQSAHLMHIVSVLLHYHMDITGYYSDSTGGKYIKVRSVP